MQTVFPTLRISSHEQALAFYVRGLGFAVDWEWRHEPGFPIFMQVSRAGAALYLSEHTGDGQPGGCAHLYVSDVDSWYAGIVAAGVAVEQPPADQAWGVRDLVLFDPFGNRIVIAQRLARARGESEFIATHGGRFMSRDGRAGRSAALSRKKVCFVATDKPFLISLLYELSLREDCCFVKYSVEPRDGMYLGRCFLTTAEAAGRLCQEHKLDPKLMVTIQDDDFFEAYR